MRLEENDQKDDQKDEATNTDIHGFTPVFLFGFINDPPAFRLPSRTRILALSPCHGRFIAVQN